MPNAGTNGGKRKACPLHAANNLKQSKLYVKQSLVACLPEDVGNYCLGEIINDTDVTIRSDAQYATDVDASDDDDADFEVSDMDTSV